MLAGFARAGLMLVPPECIDGLAHTDDPFCPQGENGSVAVIDIDDNDPDDDPEINGVIQPEVDYLHAAGPTPTFHVWTGPRYRLPEKVCASPDPEINDTACSVQADCDMGACLKAPRAQIGDSAPCNSRFRVEVSSDPAFPGHATLRSQWLEVDTNAETPESTECYGAWTPPDRDVWLDFLGSVDFEVPFSLYYRAATTDRDARTLRLSTEPGNGLGVLPPPYAVFTRDGRPEF